MYEIVIGVAWCLLFQDDNYDDDDDDDGDDDDDDDMTLYEDDAEKGCQCVKE